MKRNNKLFVTVTRNFVKSAIASGNHFSWGVIKPHLKSLKNHLRAEKVMVFAWTLYCC
ncbi:hypothetical protein [uncultured Bartonella sp.]|uniref:hypothetical protein n=1 Tax=uncultured Bartonella sp. TaxID=104108 RepID=UPI0025EEF5BD|nr:hypothetical protein [uncultured Bartonella sp.]